MFETIKLSQETAKQYEVISGKKTKDLLDNLSRINIFIGSNNSGKSRLLRELFGRIDYHVVPDGFNVINLKQRIVEYENAITSELVNYTVDLRPIKTKLAPLNFTYLFALSEKLLNSDIHSLVKAITTGKEEIVNNLNRTNRQNLLKPVLRVLDKAYSEYFDDYINHIKQIEERNCFRYYIPTLRSLKDLFPGSNKYQDTFNEKAVEHYFKKSQTYFANISRYIFTGLEFYDKVKHESHHDYTNRKRLRDFEEFLSESFFNNAKVEITPHNDGKTRITINEEERNIENLGDGIQSIIILTYPLFVNQGNYATFFFEEPETHLHPGFQRLFMETLRRPEFHTFQYYISTHSNHFLDITLEHDDMSVYTFKKEIKDDTIKFIVENVAHGDDNILQLIGANKSSVFLSNCTIWVEGITDRIYLRQYLDLYQDNIEDNKDAKVFKEDYHYSFVEYGGGNITHWSFLDSDDEAHENINIERLCAKAFVVTDSDNAKPNSKKKLRQELLREKLGDERYYCLEAKEIENLLTKDIIEKVVLSYEKEGTVVDFTKLEDKDIPNKGLGKLIDTTVKGMINKKKYKHKSSDTLNDKVGFAKRAVEYMDDFNKLSDEAKDLAKNLYGFINSNNQ